jgi:hypothetical protein
LFHNTFKIDLRGDSMRKGKKESEPIPKEKQGKGKELECPQIVDTGKSEI